MAALKPLIPLSKMMEQLKHECGVAMIRLLKPLSYYERKYGTWRYGLNKLYLMMEKQHNRGQEGAGVACVNLDAPAGEEYMFRERAEGKDAITEVFKHLVDVCHIEVAAQAEVLCPPVVSTQERMDILQSSFVCGGIAQVSHIQLTGEG